MASLAESGIASVPTQDLAQLQEYLLWHRQPSATAPHRDGAHEAANGDHGGDGLQQNNSGSNVEAESSESANAYRRPHPSPTAPAPRIATSKSAPAAEMEAMLQPRPSQEVIAAMTRASSFHGYPDGDTQPMESQVYRDYTKSMVQCADETPKKAVLDVRISPHVQVYSDDTTVTDKTPKTCQEGDTEFIDLVRAWRPASLTAHSAFDIDELPASPQTQLHVPTQVGEAAMPETPAVAGHKRDYNGELLTSATTTTKNTPGLTQLFGGPTKGEAMTATQLFNQTQAPSSPVQDVLRSDPVITRPSPNLNNHGAVSSPTVIMSSPVQLMHSRAAAMVEGAVVGGPRETYTSMRESQERRAARLRQEQATRRNVSYDDEDDGEDMRVTQEHRRMQKVLSDQAQTDWSRFSAPSRPGSRPSSSRKRSATVSLVTPTPARKIQRVNINRSDGEDGSDEGNLHVFEDDYKHNTVDQDDDIYDELGQTVLRSQSHVEDDDEDDIPMTDDVRDDGVEELQENRVTEAVLSQNYEAHQEANARKAITRTQHSTIVEPPKQKAADEGTPVERPSVLSIVRGSQGITENDRVETLTAETGVRAPSSINATEWRESQKVSSSPPLPAAGLPTASSTVPTNSAEASVAHHDLLFRFRPQAMPAEVRAISQQEIPESDILRSDDARPSAPEVASASAPQDDSNSVPPFFTAKTQLSVSGPSPTKTSASLSPLKFFLSQQSKASSQSPRKVAGVRGFTDIAADPSPPHGSTETSIDVEAIMGDVMTAEDHQFVTAISSPPSEKPNKRRKLRYTLPSSSPKKAWQDDEHCPESNEQADVPHRDRGPNSDTNHGAPAQPQQRMSNVLQSSPSKANELPASMPEGVELPKSTQDNVRMREEAGADAVAKLLYARPAKRGKLKKLARNGRDVSISDIEDQSLAPPSNRLKLSLKPSKVKSAAHAQTNPHSHARRQEDRGTLKNDIRDPKTGNSGCAVNHSQEHGVEAISAPHRIFALFKGTFNAFYPASWLASSADGKTYRVRFDDSTVTSLEHHQVCSLKLEVGDQVKVDGAGTRNKTWIVKGFGRVAKSDEERAVGTDQRGRPTVRVQAKASRSSLLAASAVDHGDSDVVDVLVTNIYITHSMWPHFVNRTFAPPRLAPPVLSRAATPSTGVQTPNVGSPESRSRRTVVPPAKASLGRISCLRDELRESVRAPASKGLFKGMAFAISYGSNESDRADVVRQIQQNDGCVLESGFNELFDLPGLDESAPNSPRKRSPRQDETANPDEVGLRLKPEYEDLGFVALIADRHSRREKYMQALALGLPALSDRWLTDSLEANGNAPLPWSKYLLAAGESAFLNGAIRSRTIPIYDAVGAKLVDTIKNRNFTLNGDGVLMVAPEKGKGAWEKRKAYAFLTLAIGAGHFKRVADLHEARTLTLEEPDKWKWVYVDDSTTEASDALFTGSNPRSRKRKRNEGSSKVDVKARSAGDRSVRVVNDEFVVQSLILGALVD